MSGSGRLLKRPAVKATSRAFRVLAITGVVFILATCWSGRQHKIISIFS